MDVLQLWSVRMITKIVRGDVKVGRQPGLHAGKVYGVNIKDVPKERLIEVTAMMIRQGVVVLKKDINYFTHMLIHYI